MTENNQDNIKGIVRLKKNNEEYTFWTHRKVVGSYIENELKKRFPDEIVMIEVNGIDVVVIGKNLPIEIQATIASKNGVYTSSFEKNIEKQIKENIENHGMCWFFFDSELYRYIKNPNISKRVCIGMDWLRKYMKDGKLKVFTVRYDGIINELEYKDFDFISNISMTCKVAYYNDDRVLNRNRLVILDRVLKGNNYTQKEIDSYRDEWKKNKGGFVPFLYKHKDERARKLAQILHVVSGYLEVVNDILDLNVEEFDRKHQLSYLSVLGLIKTEKRGVDSMGIHVDEYSVGECIPGYLREKAKWDAIKGKWIRLSRLESIVMRKYDITKGVDYYWQR